MKTLYGTILWLLLLSGPLALALALVAQHHLAPAPLAGTFNVTGGGTYRLYSSIGTSQTTLTLSSFKEPASNIPYTMTYLNSDIEYGTIDPNSNSISEFVSFTGITQNSDGTATLSGVARGLLRTPGHSGACTASTTLAQAHSGQAIFILSNSPCFQNEYVPLRTNATSTGILTLGSTTPWRYDNVGAQKSGSAIATTSELASVAYVNAVAVAGANNADATTKGIVQFATASQAASSTVTGSTVANLSLWAKYATDTPNTLTRGTVIPMTTIQGFLSPSWLDFSQNFTFTGAVNILASAAKQLTLNSLAYTFPSVRGASSTAMMEDGSGNLTYEKVPYLLYQNTGVNSATTAAATTTLATATIAANTLSTTNSLRITGEWYTSGGSGICYPDLSYGNGTATTTIGFTSDGGNFTMQQITATLYATSTSAEVATSWAYDTYPGTNTQGWKAFFGFNTNTRTYIAFGAKNLNGATPSCTFVGGSVEVLPI